MYVEGLSMELDLHLKSKVFRYCNCNEEEAFVCISLIPTNAQAHAKRFCFGYIS